MKRTAGKLVMALLLIFCTAGRLAGYPARLNKEEDSGEHGHYTKMTVHSIDKTLSRIMPIYLLDKFTL